MTSSRNSAAVLGIVVVFAVLAGGCGGNNGADTASAEVALKNIAFKPAVLEIPAGTQVTWRNEDAGVTHTATSGTPGDPGVPGLQEAEPNDTDGLFDGEMVGDGVTYSFTFDEPGTYPYFCEVHPSMTAKVVVT